MDIIFGNFNVQRRAVEDSNSFQVPLEVSCVLHGLEYLVQVLVTIYCLYVLYRANRLHIHFRSIIAVTVISGIFVYLGRGLCSIFSRLGWNDLRMLNYCCCILSTIHVSAIITMVTSICVTGLERFMASKLSNSYEKIERPMVIVVFTTLVSVFTGVIVNYYSSIRYINLEESPRHQVFIIFERNIVLTTLSFACGLLCTGSGGMIQMYSNQVSVQKFKDRRGRASLTERFQSRETAVSSEVLTKIAGFFIVTCTIGLIYCCLRMINFGCYGDGSHLDMFLVELGYFQIDVTVPVVLIYFMTSHHYLRSIVRKDVIKVLGQQTADRILKADDMFIQPPTSSYFQQMDDMWNAPELMRTPERSKIAMKRASESYSNPTTVENIKARSRKFSVKIVDIF